MIDWAHGSWLFGLFAVPVVALLGVWAWRRRRAALAAFAAVDALRSLLPAHVLRYRGWQVLLGTLALTGMVLAAAGPRLGFEWETRRAKGVAIAMVLDVSRSMDAMDDGTTARLTLAQRKVRDFVGLLRGDQVGLVLFANGAYPRIPLTADYGTVLWALDDTSTATLRAQGTTMSDALVSATKMLERGGSAGKAILLVSDGEGHDDGARLDRAITMAKENEVRIFALGVGEEKGAPIPMPEGGFKKDREGNVVLSKLDASLLTRLASETGGAYVQAGPSVSDVRGLYETEIRGKLQAAERDARRDKVWNERFQWPLGGAFVLMVVSAALGIARRPSAAILLLALILPMQAWASPRGDGLAAAQKQDWSEAIRLLGQARVGDPSDVTVGHALAESLYRAGRYREAEQVFRSLAQTDGANKARHLYNAGNSAYRDGRLDDAAKALKEAAAADPQFAAAQKNATAVDKEIAARRQQKQEKQDPQSGDQGDKGQQGDDAQQGQQGQEGQQDGQQGQQSGDLGDQPKDGQDQSGGQPQDGQQDQAQGQDPQAGLDGQQQGQQGQQGQQAQGQDPQGQQGQDAQGQGNDAGKPGEEQDGAGGGPGELRQDGEAGDEKGSAIAAGGDGSGDMTPEEAARLVDSVPDGAARTAVGGEDAEKDW